MKEDKDAAFFAVFDGHGGAKCSEFIKENLYQILSYHKNIITDPSSALTETVLKL